jgi:hypothetical protein
MPLFNFTRRRRRKKKKQLRKYDDELPVDSIKEIVTIDII